MKINKIKLELPTEALALIKRAYQAGGEMYAVGGFVRDSLLGKAKKGDVDFTTNLLPEQVKSLFSECRIIETGIKHGTVTIVFEDIPFEITTYRSDGMYSDFRHPELVSFQTSLSEDLARRDFTINALCYFEDGEEYGIVDIFGGIEDIECKIIKAIGEPQKRFSEDALRILRGYRFMATLGFEIEEKTRAAMVMSANLLKNISAERKSSELFGLLNAKHPSNAVVAMQDDGIFQSLISDFSPLDDNALRALNKAESLTAKVGILFLNQPLDIFSEIKVDKQTQRTISFFKEQKGTVLNSDKKSLKHMLFLHGLENINLLLDFQMAMSIVKDGKEIRKVIDEITKNGECYSLKQLDISGDDIKCLFEEIDGVKIGKLLQKLLFCVIDEAVSNQKDVLIKKIKEIY